MNWALISVLVITAAISWWLSGYDTRLSGQMEHRGRDLTRRLLRCGVTLIIIGFAAWLFIGGRVFEAFIGVVFMLPLAPIWMGCLSELSARGVMGLIDREDHRQFDSRQVPRDLDRLAGLVRAGRYEQAVVLCRQLSESNEVSALAMDAQLFQLYQELFSEERITRSPVLAEAVRLRGQRQFAEAAVKLNAVLKRDPLNLAAALLLMRIQTQDLSRPDQAAALLENLARQPHAPPAFAGYARRRIGEWSGAVAPRPKTSENIESLLVNPNASRAPEIGPDFNLASVNELLAKGRLSTAIEMLENKVRAEPREFEVWMKLAEAHGVYCRDLARAGKIIDKLAGNAAFTPEQVRSARETLKEWKTRGEKRTG
jgi:tetratricopeptide (TPR) repeat protein